MASRVYQVGTIVSRTNKLLLTGVLKQRPVWLDVVEAFPPDVMPTHNRTPEGGRAPVLVYPEDHLRRTFYKEYTIREEPEKSYVSLFEGGDEDTSICSRFVSEQMDRMSKGEDQETAAQAAMQALRSEGVDIKQREVEKPGTPGDEKTGEKSPSPLHSLQTLLHQLRAK